MDREKLKRISALAGRWQTFQEPDDVSICEEKRAFILAAELVAWTCNASRLQVVPVLEVKPNCKVSPSSRQQKTSHRGSLKGIDAKRDPRQRGARSLSAAHLRCGRPGVELQIGLWQLELAGASGPRAALVAGGGDAAREMGKTGIFRGDGGGWRSKPKGCQKPKKHVSMVWFSL